MQIQRTLSLVLAFQFGLGALLAQEPAVNQPPPETAPAPTPATPAAQPTAAPTDVVADKNLQLRALLDMYVKDQISAGEYQRRRAEILGRSRGSSEDPWDRASVRSSRVEKPAALVTSNAVVTAPVPGDAPAKQDSSLAKLASSATGIASAVLGSSPLLDAAIVPSADLYFQIDFQSARQAPIYPVIAKLLEKKPTAETAAPAAEMMKKVEVLDVLEQRLGLKQEDIERLVFSADLDKVQMGAGQSTSMESVPGVAAIQLSKEVTTAQLKEAIEASAKENSLTVTEAKLGPADILIVKSQDEKDPKIHLTVVGGKTILAGLNQTSLSSALTRASGSPTQLSGALAASQRAIPAASQVKLGFVVPQSFKDMLKGLSEPANGGAGAPPAGGGPGAMLGGLKDLKTVSLGIALAEGAAVQISSDMGQPQAADGVNMLVQLMKPQVVTSIAQQLGKDPSALPANLINSRTSGSKVDISLVFNREILESMAKE
jgi:hypothetical protein